jgi:hypothetical protein
MRYKGELVQSEDEQLIQRSNTQNNTINPEDSVVPNTQGTATTLLSQMLSQVCFNTDIMYLAYHICTDY